MKVYPSIKSKIIHLSGLFTLISLVLFLGEVKSQPHLDSLYGIWFDESQTDSLRIQSFSDYIDQRYLANSLPDSAILLADDLLSFSELGNNLRGVVMAYHLQDMAYEQMGVGHEAQDLYEVNLEKQQSVSDRPDYQKVLEECMAFLELSREINSLRIQKEACRCIYSSYKSLGNARRALEYYEMSVELGDSLNEVEVAKKLQKMEFEKQVIADSLVREEEKQRIEMAHLDVIHQKEATRNIFIGIGMILLLIVTGLYARYRYINRARIQIEKEKDRSEGLLLNILPAEIAEELKVNGEAAARNFEMVSVLFTDFKNFTSASESLSASDLVEEINVCFKEFDRIVDLYSIEKIKTIGDAYMAAGGIPISSADATVNTVLAALDMQAFMVKHNSERSASGLPTFNMRVGIHTGPVVAGIVGVKKFQYDVWGDTVNTASRMESNGEVGEVNISSTTHSYLKDQVNFRFRSRGEIDVKGKGSFIRIARCIFYLVHQIAVFIIKLPKPFTY